MYTRIVIAFTTIIIVASNIGLGQISRNNALKIIKNAQSVNLEDLNYTLCLDSLFENTLPLISGEFKDLYQVDTLLDNYDENSDLLYVIGKSEFKNYYSLVIKHNYGEWFSAVETLNYNIHGDLIGIYFNATNASEILFTGSGKYISNTEYMFEYLYDSEDSGKYLCYDKCILYSISINGHISKKVIYNNEVNCPE